MLQHCIQNDQEFPYAGRERYLLGFASPTESLVEDADHGVEARGDDRVHIEDGSHMSPPPHTVRFPRSVPLSRLKGATPTSAARSLTTQADTRSRIRPQCFMRGSIMPYAEKYKTYEPVAQTH